jgi:hypothetical protein
VIEARTIVSAGKGKPFSSTTTFLGSTVHPLLGKRHTLAAAEHTLLLTLRAAKQGDLRLAVSRGITTIIQASSAAMGGSKETINKAANIVQGVRNVIHTAVISKQAAGMLDGRIRDPFSSMRRAVSKKTTPVKRTHDFKTMSIPGGIFIPSNNPLALETFLMRGGVPGRALRSIPGGVEVDEGIIADQEGERKIDAATMSKNLISFGLKRWSQGKDFSFRKNFLERLSSLLAV